MIVHREEEKNRQDNFDIKFTHAPSSYLSTVFLSSLSSIQESTIYYYISLVGELPHELLVLNSSRDLKVVSKIATAIDK